MRTAAVVGATGLVGREIIRLIEERDFPAERIRLFASRRSVGTEAFVRGQAVTLEDPEVADLSGIDVAFFSAGGAASLRLGPRFADAGAYVVDNSSAFRQDPGIPLVVPEINPDALGESESRIIANPNCSTIIMLMPLAPLHRRFGVRRVVVSTYQSVSGAGKAAVDELMSQGRAFAAGEDEPTEVYDRPIHLNLIPQIGSIDASGFSQEEHKMVVETHKILDAPEIEVLPTTVRVPVERCHSESVYVELERPATAEAILAEWEDFPGLVHIGLEDERKWPTPRELAGTFDTYVGRLRPAPGRSDAWLFWVVADQLLKGAALNALQIGELLVQQGRC